MTGLDQTLVRGSKPFGAGAVGLALLGEPQPKLDRGFHGLKPISKTYSITRLVSKLYPQWVGTATSDTGVLDWDFGW